MSENVGPSMPDLSPRAKPREPLDDTPCRHCLGWSWSRTWAPYDESGPTVWRRQLRDGTVLEVFAGTWAHVRVDEDGWWDVHDDDCTFAEGHVGKHDDQGAMWAADDYARDL